MPVLCISACGVDLLACLNFDYGVLLLACDSFASLAVYCQVGTMERSDALHKRS